MLCPPTSPWRVPGRLCLLEQFALVPDDLISERQVGPGVAYYLLTLAAQHKFQELADWPRQFCARSAAHEHVDESCQRVAPVLDCFAGGRDVWATVLFCNWHHTQRRITSRLSQPAPCD